jgi:hypothetical protein
MDHPQVSLLRLIHTSLEIFLLLRRETLSGVLRSRCCEFVSREESATASHRTARDTKNMYWLSPEKKALRWPCWMPAPDKPLAFLQRMANELVPWWVTTDSLHEKKKIVSLFQMRRSTLTLREGSLRADDAVVAFPVAAIKVWRADCLLR